MNVSSTNSTSSMISMKRPDSSKMTDDLFSTLDKKGKGYLDKNDLASVFSSDSFSKLDTDSNGKITKVEMKTALEKLAATLDAPLKTRLQGQMPPQGAGRMPPPPPQGAGQNDQGLTKDQLTSMSKETSEQANVMSDIASNFDAADTNGDGKVTASETIAYENSKNSSSTSNINASASSTTATSDTDTKLMTQMMDLLKIMQNYMNPTDSTTKNNALLTTTS